MKVAFLVHVDVPDGTPVPELRESIARAIRVELDPKFAGGITNPVVDARSAQTYNPEWGGVVVYQP